MWKLVFNCGRDGNARLMPAVHHLLWAPSDADKVNAVSVACSVWQVVTEVCAIHRNGFAVWQDSHLFEEETEEEDEESLQYAVCMLASSLFLCGWR